MPEIDHNTLERLLNKTYDSGLSFVLRQTMKQSHSRKSATCSSWNIFNGGVVEVLNVITVLNVIKS